MPIYEYACKSCGQRFEALVRRDEVPACPSCGAAELDRLLSLPYVKSETTKDLAQRAARRRDQAQATEKVQEQIKYERSHND
jgi:putative FmdB family regulatory protein